MAVTKPSVRCTRPSRTITLWSQQGAEAANTDNLVGSSVMLPTPSFPQENHSWHQSIHVFHQYSSQACHHKSKETNYVCMQKKCESREWRNLEQAAKSQIRKGSAERHDRRYKMPWLWSTSPSSQGNSPTYYQKLRENQSAQTETKQGKALQVVGTQPTIWDSNLVRPICPRVPYRQMKTYPQTLNCGIHLHKSIWHKGVLRQL